MRGETCLNKKKKQLTQLNLLSITITWISESSQTICGVYAKTFSSLCDVTKGPATSCNSVTTPSARCFSPSDPVSVTA